MSTAPTGHDSSLHDRRIERIVPLATPAELLGEQPLSAEDAEFVVRSRDEVGAILDRQDPRLLVIVGPCSVHDPTPPSTTHTGSRRWRTSSRTCSSSMRVYFEKPRTTTGWKGLINDPHLDNSGDVNAGLRTARGLLLQVLATGLPIGCEYLDPITPQYIADTVAWGAIGARTTESQTHRQLASGLSMPIGFKNRTDGNVGGRRRRGARRSGQALLRRGRALGRLGDPATTGNDDCHIILRGGRSATNFEAEAIADTLEQLRAVGLPERVIVDASHDNSGKDDERQPGVAEAVGRQVAAGNEAIVGVMLESFLVGGRQDLGGKLTYGQSVTDKCMDWETTVGVLRGLDDAARARREAA